MDGITIRFVVEFKMREVCEIICVSTSVIICMLRYVLYRHRNKEKISKFLVVLAVLVLIDFFCILLVVRHPADSDDNGSGSSEAGIEMIQESDTPPVESSEAPDIPVGSEDSTGTSQYTPNDKVEETVGDSESNTDSENDAGSKSDAGSNTNNEASGESNDSGFPENVSHGVDILEDRVLAWAESVNGTTMTVSDAPTMDCSDLYFVISEDDSRIVFENDTGQTVRYTVGVDGKTITLPDAEAGASVIWDTNDFGITKYTECALSISRAAENGEELIYTTTLKIDVKKGEV